MVHSMDMFINGDVYCIYNMKIKKKFVNCKNCKKKFNGLKYYKSTRKREGKIVPRLDYKLIKFCSDKCYKEYFVKINTGKNNPMYGVTGKDNPLYGRHRPKNINKKVSETRKKLFAEGKIKVWCDGLTKETNPSLKRGGKKMSKTKIRLHKEGKWIPQ